LRRMLKSLLLLLLLLLLQVRACKNASVDAGGMYACVRKYMWCVCVVYMYVCVQLCACICV